MRRSALDLRGRSPRRAEPWPPAAVESGVGAHGRGQGGKGAPGGTASLLDALPTAGYTTDANGRITFFSQAAVQLSGRTPEIASDSWCVTWRLYWPDGRAMAHDACPMARTLKEDRSIRGEEATRRNTAP